MKKGNKKIREPYEPEQTPKPPQIIDPNARQQRENPVEGDHRPEPRSEADNQPEREKRNKRQVAPAGRRLRN